MQTIVPDLNWYLAKSKENGVPPRCPFATADRCPRFYQSLSLLGKAGSTSIEPDEDERLRKKWIDSDLWPLTGEQATGIAGPNGNFKHFTKFCPEVAFERFGYFASNLNQYADEIDSDLAHRQLANEGASRDDWRWSWSHVLPNHYTECPLYSLLIQNYSKGQSESQNQKPDRVESFIKWARSHPVVSTLIILGLIVLAVASMTDAFSKIQNTLTKMLAQ